MAEPLDIEWHGIRPGKVWPTYAIASDSGSDGRLVREGQPACHASQKVLDGWGSDASIRISIAGSQASQSSGNRSRSGGRAAGRSSCLLATWAEEKVVGHVFRR